MNTDPLPVKCFSLLTTLVFLFFYLSGEAQSNIQQDWRADPLLKQVAGNRSGLKIFNRQDGKGGYINMAVLDENTAQLKWFTCHGIVFDSVQLDKGELSRFTPKPVIRILLINLRETNQLQPLTWMGWRSLLKPAGIT